MQQIFSIDISIEQYAIQGESFNFPVPDSCPNPDCISHDPPKKHGFYERNCLDFTYQGKILIRRYYCPHCAKTISYLPSFCLPYFQYSLAIIYLVLLYYYEFNKSSLYILNSLKEKYSSLALSIQQIMFYVIRFAMRLNTIKMGIRSILPDTVFNQESLALKKGAIEILGIINNRFGEIKTFSKKFFQQYKYSFLASVQIISA